MSSGVTRDASLHLPLEAFLRKCWAPAMLCRSIRRWQQAIWLAGLEEVEDLVLFFQASFVRFELNGPGHPSDGAFKVTHLGQCHTERRQALGFLPVRALAGDRRRLDSTSAVAEPCFGAVGPEQGLQPEDVQTFGRDLRSRIQILGGLVEEPLL